MHILKSCLIFVALSFRLNAASIDDLWITEVVPSTGQVEVTNVGDGPVTTPGALPFCHRFSYGESIPGGTSFAQGESKVFAVSFSNSADSDLWLYRQAPFNAAANIITGLKWGPAADIGRTGIATGAGLWSGPNLPVPAGGMALRLTGTDPTRSSSWTIAPIDLGAHAFPFGPVSVAVDETGIELAWEGGSAPFRVETSSGLGPWTPLTGLLQDRHHSLARVAGEERRFFRIRGQATLEASAEFRITFTSLWSTDRFASVPGGDHFSELVGGLHDASVSFWSPGTNASTGIKNMAETGLKTALLQEVQAAITNGSANQTLSGNGLGGGGSQTTLDFSAQRSHPRITITSMIAPSPDWFVGLHDQSLLQDNDDWVEELTFELLAYDAGTDSGLAFTSVNQPTVPPVPVFLIPASNPNFAPAEGSPGDPIPIARLKIERVGE